MRPYKRILMFACLILVLSAMVDIRLTGDRAWLEPAQNAMAEDDGKERERERNVLSALTKPRTREETGRTSHRRSRRMQKKKKKKDFKN